jgi:DeoR/GlpR family transcriptional regulator of sugar metabolism
VKKTKGLKLNATQVKTIKTILANPKRKLTHKQLADKFKITPMTIYRIKRGENWGSI